MKFKSIGMHAGWTDPHVSSFFWNIRGYNVDWESQLWLGVTFELQFRLGATFELQLRMLHWSYIGATLQCIGATLWILGKGSPQNRGNTSPWAEQCGLNIAISRSQMQIKRSPIPTEYSAQQCNTFRCREISNFVGCQLCNSYWNLVVVRISEPI